MELLVGATVGVILSLALFGFLDTTSKSSEQTAARIDAAKLGRPVMASIVDRLHSTCVAADTIPVRAGSNGVRLDFIHQTGSGVTLVPSLRSIRWIESQRRLVEYVFPRIGGAAPDWTFASSAPERILLQPVDRGPGNVVFRYYAYDTSGNLTQLPTGSTLDETTAARVVQVGVSFEVPSRVEDDPNGGTTFSDTVLLRFTPPGLDAGLETRPCT